MLYQNHAAGDFSAITEALRDIGVYDRALEILPDYLNTDNPRNNALLDDITLQQFGQINYQLREKLEKAVKREIDRVNVNELYERWFLFVHAVAGSACMMLNLRTEMQYDAWEKAVVSAFRSRFGEDAQAVYYAIRITGHTFTFKYFTLFNSKREKPEVCLRAAHYASNSVVRMILGMYALNGMTPPEQKKGLMKLFSGNQDKQAEEALALIGEAAQDAGLDAYCEEYLLTALAEASLFSEEYKKLFESRVGVWRVCVAEKALNMPIDPEHIFNVLDELPLSQDTPNYISFLARTVLKGVHSRGYDNGGDRLTEREKHLKRMVERCPGQYRTQMEKEDDPSVVVLMEKVLTAVTGTAPEISARDLTKARCLAVLNKLNPNPEIADFLYGRTDIQPLLAIVPQLQKYQNYWSIDRIDYVGAFDLDDFAGRVITYLALVAKEFSCYLLIDIPGYARHAGRIARVDPKPLIDILHQNGLPMEYLLNAIAQYSASFYDSDETKSKEQARLALKAYVEKIAAADVKALSAEARCLYVQVLGDAGKYSDKLIALTDDGSKAVRAVLCDYLPQDEALIRSLLKAKKGTKREMAAALLEKSFPEALRSDVEAAFAAEKSNAVKKRLADLLGAALPEEAKAEMTGDIVTELTKGNKAKKVAWLYADPFKPVRKADGTEAEDAYLQALLLCYANANPLGRSTMADGLAEGLNKDDLEHFAAEVFARWVNVGAQAKTKWVLYFTAVHGGLPMVEALQRYIKDWSEHSRGAIAAEAASALAMNGSSIALIAVDNMARKFKNKQVRAAAGAALEHAAEELHLTREELADQIVPDLGFDEQLCRMFDFGARQFRVYLTPALELEIFEGEKRLKNLPKPGTKDDPELSAAAVKDFKEMKKQMKAAIQSQRQRLEYVLLCDRKWTADGWRDLFIRKAVMHSFAIGLVWGVYENDKLVQSFRYMEDGSFNTPDEEEYTLPEGAQIGLVHPLELDEETLSAWREQLADYEITQPFAQLDRPVFRLTEEEKKQKALLRFEDKELSDVMLLGRMTKLGWDKGDPQDAGMFYEFRRTDIIRQEKQEDGRLKKIGYCTEMRFSGMYAGGFDYSNPEDVSIGKVEFCAPGDGSSWVDENPKAIPLGEISERYMSEIIAQLSDVLAVTAKEEEK